MSTTIRKANDTDIEWLKAQLKEFAKFNNSDKNLYTAEYADEFVPMVINTPEYLCLIAERDRNTRVGFVTGMITPHMYNPKLKTLVEMFWWVDPAYRMSRAGLMLLNYFTEIGKETADWIVFTLEHHSPVNEKSLLKRGYKLKERNYLYEVNA